jgi:hypothetical protein
MTAFEVFRTYLAMKAHFTTASYDIFKYKGAVSAKMDTYEKRKDKFRMQKMASTMKDHDIVQFFLANFTRVASYAGLFDDKSEERYRIHNGYMMAFKYHFKNEITAMYRLAEEEGTDYNSMYSSDDGHPLVVREYLGKGISLETFIVLDRINSFTDSMDNNIVTETVLRVSKKYSPFLKLDMNDYEHIERTVRENIFGK